MNLRARGTNILILSSITTILLLSQDLISSLDNLLRKFKKRNRRKMSPDQLGEARQRVSRRSRRKKHPKARKNLKI